MPDWLLIWARRVWKMASLALLLGSLLMLFQKGPEAKKYGLALLLADLALGWLAVHQKGLEWVIKLWGRNKNLQARGVIEMVQVGGGMTLAAMLVSLGAFILFAETCLPFRLYSK